MKDEAGEANRPVSPSSRLAASTRAIRDARALMTGEGAFSDPTLGEIWHRLNRKRMKYRLC